MLLSGMLIVLTLMSAYKPSGPRKIESETTTTEDSTPTNEDPCSGRGSFVEPTRQKAGSEKHHGPLPGDLEPLHYAITMTLCGELSRLNKHLYRC
ncbi:hypothetical protein MTO96_026879 [Rhipicephalus appendiculatus]